VWRTARISLTLLAVAALCAPTGATARTAKLAGTVWIDANGDGVRARGEARAPGVAVTIEQRNKAGRFRKLTTLTTNASGGWSRAVRKTATLRVKIGLPSTASAFSPRRKGRNRGLDSDVSARGVSSAAKVVARKTSARIDAGLLSKPAVPGTGAGGNQPGSGGAEQPPPPPPPVLAGIVWSDADNDGIRDPGESPLPGAIVEVWDANRTSSVGALTTGADGRWSFPVPVPGDSYRVRLVLPDGTIYSPTVVGTDRTVDSDINDRGAHAGFSDRTVSAGPVTTVDAGVATPAAITIGNEIWMDDNTNGLREPGDSLYSQPHTLELWNDSLTQKLATTASSGGTYSLPARSGGVYRLKAILPGGELFTLPNQGLDEAADSDVARTGPLAGVSDSLSFTASQTSVDVGVVFPANIGNFVWTDNNSNGVQEAGEPGVAGITVQLWNASKTVMVDSTTTNSSGVYTLQTIGPGDYRIRVLTMDLHSFTTKDAGANDQLDSDINTSGPHDGYSDAFTVAPNVVSITTRDAGFLP
jgi:protocatechuate 3,4-dioxygenase beta subunit